MDHLDMWFVGNIFYADFGKWHAWQAKPPLPGFLSGRPDVTYVIYTLYGTLTSPF